MAAQSTLGGFIQRDETCGVMNRLAVVLNFAFPPELEEAYLEFLTGRSLQTLITASVANAIYHLVLLGFEFMFEGDFGPPPISFRNICLAVLTLANVLMVIVCLLKSSAAVGPTPRQIEVLRCVFGYLIFVHVLIQDYSYTGVVIDEYCSDGKYGLGKFWKLLHGICGKDFWRGGRYAIPWASFVVLPVRFPLVYPTVPVVLLLTAAVRAAHGDQPFVALDVMFAILLLLMLGLIRVYTFNIRRNFLVAHQLKQQLDLIDASKAKVLAIVEQLLPQSVLLRLLQGQRPTDFGVATVIFSDVAGFTAWSSTQKPVGVVRFVNRMYERFDSNLHAHDVVKVKTIGDAYWALSGLLPTGNTDPSLSSAANAGMFALAMQKELREMRVEDRDAWGRCHIRVGVHTGAVYAAIVGPRGSHGGTYEVFGDTNDVAMEAESRSQVDGVAITSATFKALRGVKADVTSTEEAVGTQSEFPLLQLKALEKTELGEEELGGRTDERVVDEDVPPGMDLADVGLALRLFRRKTEKLGDSVNSGGSDSQPPTLPVVAEPESPLWDKDTSSSATAPSTQNLPARRDEFSRQKRCSVEFEDPETEVEYREKTRPLHQNSGLIAKSALCVIVLLVAMEAALEDYPQPWLVYIALSLCSLLFWLLGAASMKLDPLVSRLCFYLVYIGFMVVVSAMGPTAVSILPDSVPLVFVTFVHMLGTTGLSIPAAVVLDVVIPWGTHAVCYSLVSGRSVAHVVGAVFTDVVFSVLLLLVAYYLSEIALRRRFVDTKMIALSTEKVEKEKSNLSTLLNHMVPSFVAPVLVDWIADPNRKLLAHNVNHAGVMFVRINEFQDMASAANSLTSLDEWILPGNENSREVLEALMRRFQSYVDLIDKVIRRIGSDCTRIKMIGNVILIVSGLEVAARDALPAASSAQKAPHRIPNPLAALLFLALRLEEDVMRSLGARADIGLHCGPLIAGVVGTDRLAYDTFSDTVNTASRVMTLSGPGVSVTQVIWDSCCPFLETIPASITSSNPREVRAKGKGALAILDVGFTSEID